MAKSKITKIRKELERMESSIPDADDIISRHLSKAIGFLLCVESEIQERKMDEIRNMKTVSVSPKEFANLAEHVDDITDKLNKFNESQFSNFQKEVEKLGLNK